MKKTYKNISFRLEVTDYEKAKDIIGLGNISRLIREVFSALARIENIDDEQLLRNMQARLVVLQVTRDMVYNRLLQLENQIAELSQEIVNQRKIIAEEKREIEIKMLFEQLRDTVYECNYDVECVWDSAAKIIWLLNKKYGFEIDKTWVEKYVKRIYYYG